MFFDVGPNEVVDDIELVVDQEIHRGYVSGTILNADGQPITNGMVFAQPAGIPIDSDVEWHKRRSPEDDIAETVPNEKGEFKLANLKIGTTVDILYRGPSGPRQATSAANISVPTEGVVVTFVSSEPNIRVTVRGRVVDERTHEPINRFSVTTTVFERLSAGSALTVYSHADGLFEIQDARYISGRTYVYAEADGYAGSFVPVAPDDGTGEAWVEIGLGARANSAGHVVNMAGSPVEGASLSLMGSECVSGPGGEFELANLRKGKGAAWQSFLRVFHPDYAPVAIPEVVVPEDTVVRNYVVRLGQGGTVTGVVLDDGSPVEHADVRIGNISDTSVQNLYHAQTDSHGVYIAEMMPPGAYSVEVRSLKSEVLQIIVEEGMTSYADFGVVGSVVSGSVYLDDEPLPSATMILTETRPEGQYYDEILADEFHVEARTDHHGDYIIRGVPPGSYYLTVYKHGILKSVPVEVPESGGLQKDIDI